MARPIWTLAKARGEDTRGSVWEVFDLAYPVVITQLSTTLMHAVDSAMVGRLGATQLAAVGFAGIWLWTLFSLLFGTATGVQTFVSQAHGAKRPRECGPWVWQALYALVPAAFVLVLIVAAGVEPALALLGPSEALQLASMEYMVARLPGELAFTATMVFVSFYRGLGDTRTPLYVTLFVNVVNAVLDYGLIFGAFGLPAWGVTGAGVATALSQIVGAITLFAVFRRRALSRCFATAHVPPDRSAIGRFLWTGAPIGGQWFLDMMAFALFTTLVARMGDQPMAANQALLVLLSFSFMQAVGISVATSTLVGRYIGSSVNAAARRAFRSGLLLGTGLAGIIALIFVMFPRQLLRIFTDVPEVIELGVPLVGLCAVFQFFDNAAIIGEGALRGAGDTRLPFVVQTALSWLFFLPLAYLLAVVLDKGLHGAWYAELTYISLFAVFVVWRFGSGAWERIRI
jgi:MATE family multidrug resistance protein